MNFNYNITKKSNSQIIAFSGNLIKDNQTTQLLQDVEHLISNGDNQLVMDLSQLQYMNSTGLNLLVNILTKARKAGGEVIITNVPKKINSLLIITKLNTVFTATDSIEKAIEQLELEMSN